MTRLSDNIISEDKVKSGYDYDLQVWVKNFIICDCGHSQIESCQCRQHELFGQDIRKISC